MLITAIWEFIDTWKQEALRKAWAAVGGGPDSPRSGYEVGDATKLTRTRSASGLGLMAVSTKNASRALAEPLRSESFERTKNSSAKRLRVAPRSLASRQRLTWHAGGGRPHG